MTSKQLDLTKVIIKSFIPIKTSRDIWMQYHQLNEELALELYPDDPLPKREVIEKEFCYNDPDYNVTRLLIYKDDSEKDLIGFCTFDHCKETSTIYEDNKEIGYIFIKINNKFRRQGLGTKLLKEIYPKLEAVGCKYITTESKYPTGWKFCEKFGAELTNIMKESRLNLKTIDWSQIESWISEGKRRNPDVKIESFFGASEEGIEKYTELLTELIAEAPTLEEDSKKEKEIITPQRFREYVNYLGTKTYKLFTYRSVEPDGTVSGLTEIRFSEVNTPELIDQALTGVKSIYRGRGLGKWLKALMLQYIRENLPQAKYFITGNAEHNAPMLSINDRLGFKPYRQRRSYKFTISNLKQKLLNTK